MQIMHFTPPQLASIFQVNETTIKRWIWAGKLKASLTTGRHYRVSRDQLNDFFKRYPKISLNSYVIRRYSKQKEKKIQEWEEYYDLMLKNKHEEAFVLLQSTYLSGNNITNIVDTYIVPVLHKIGFDYSKEIISIYEEHRMSFRISEQLSKLEQFVSKNNKNRKRAILLCAEGDNHIIPLQMLNLVLGKNNIDTHVLGMNISYEQLEKAVKEIKPNMICITKLYNINNPKKYLEKTKKLTKKYKIFIALGGPGWNEEIKKNLHRNIRWFGSMGSLEKFLSTKGGLKLSDL